MPLAPSNLSTVQTSTHLDLDSLGAKSQRLFDGFPHRASKGDALLELRRNLFRLQLSIQFRLVNLLNLYQYLSAGLGRQIALQLVNLSTFATDDDARARRVDDDLEAIGCAFDVDMRNACTRKSLLQIAMQRLGVGLSREPAGVPRLVESEPKSVRVDLLTQDSLRYFRARARPLPPLRSLTAFTSSET